MDGGSSCDGPLGSLNRLGSSCGAGGGTVLERLGRFGHGQDPVVSDLQDPWEAIKTLDPDEREFCRAAALLGVDPFAVHQEVAEAIAAFRERTEPAIREDMLASLEEITLPVQPALHHRETAMPSIRVEGLVAAGGPACVSRTVVCLSSRHRMQVQFSGEIHGEEASTKKEQPQGA